MGVSAIYGLPGRGKSLFSTYIGFHLAEKYQKAIVSNFPFKPLALARYFQLMGYRWLSENLEKGIIFYADTRGKPEQLLNIFLVPDSIILWDEVGSDLPSRGAIYNTPKKLLECLYQVRHEAQYLFVIAQNESQIDFALRNLVEEIFHCDGYRSYSPKLKNEQLDFKFVYRFDPDSYQVYLNDPKIRKNPLKCRVLANKCWQGWLSCMDGFSFYLYDSFTKLSQQSLASDKSWLFYESIEGFPLKRIVGKNPYKIHELNKATTILMKWLPSPFLTKLLKLDKKLSRINPLERRIFQFGLPIILLMIIGAIL